MAVRDQDSLAPVEETGRGRVGPVGIILTATVLLSVTVVLLYALIQFWPPATGATAPVTGGTTTTTSASPTTTPAGQAASGTTEQAAGEPAVQFFGAAINLSRDGRLFVIVLLAGALGAMVHSLRSLYWYVGNRNLRFSWLLMYATLPVTGATLALIAYVVVRGGLTTTFASSQDISPYGMAALAALVGLFSRETAEKLRAVFETLLAPAEKGKDQAVPVQIEGIAPTQGQVGDELRITGTGFAAATAVQFGGVRATPTVVSDTELVVNVPEGAATGPISVVTPTGMAASTAPFIPGVVEVSQPRIDRIEPLTGAVGDPVTITGRGLDNVTDVQFSGVTTPVISKSDTEIRVAVPADAPNGPITVVVGDRTLTGERDFTVT